MARPVAAAVAGAAALGAGVGLSLRDEDRRNRIDRQIRVYRLSMRRGVHWAQLRIKGRRASEEQRARLEEQFAIRSAEDVAQVLGGMKGAIMKAGQMVSFLADGLPPEAQAALATLQADVPPMSPNLAEQVVVEELGAHPESLFLDWTPVPAAAASIGQVHRAVLRDGREVAVKVQYPGVDRAIRSDLDNAELLYGMFAAFALKNMDVRSMVDELRARMADELDYQLEARCQADFAARYRGHPFIRVPEVIPELSSRRVITTEWVHGLTWAQFLDQASEEQRGRAAEILFRFAEGSIWRHGVFNGDPHPGNYRFHPDRGQVTFLDFGLVKRWSPGELESLAPILHAILRQDRPGLVEALVRARFLAPDHGLPTEVIYEFCSTPYLPFQTERFRYSSEFVATTLQRMLDMNGTYGEVIRALNMPPSYVILDRVVWGMSALFGKLGAEAGWKQMLDEYVSDAPPSTELGRIEAEWQASTPGP